MRIFIFMSYQNELQNIQDRIEAGDFSEGAAREEEMDPTPMVIRPGYKGSGKLEGKIAVISGGDSGIGRSVAVHFAREGADVVVLFHEHNLDAQETVKWIEQENRVGRAIQCDQRDKKACLAAISTIVEEFGRIDILVNNAAFQCPQKDFTAIDEDQLHRTFETNIYGYFHLTQAALPHLKSGSTIINTTSVTAYHGQEMLIDYASTKGAITAMIRSLAKPLLKKGIRINGVAPGPIWTPLITSTFPVDAIKELGGSVPMGRVGQPCEVATSYVFLASEDSSYFVGQVLHPNGGDFLHT